jgi:hypothetical protein
MGQGGKEMVSVMGTRVYEGRDVMEKETDVGMMMLLVSVSMGKGV